MSNAKALFEQAFRLDRAIEAKLEQVDKLRALCVRLAPVLTAIKVKGGSARTKEDALAELLDLERGINADIDALVAQKQTVRAVIAGVADPDYRLLLELRYVNGKTWEDIADAMYFSLRNVHYAHNKALKAADEVLMLQSGNAGEE